LYEFIVNILKVIWLLHELISVNPIVFVLKFNVDASLSQYREKVSCLFLSRLQHSSEM